MAGLSGITGLEELLVWKIACLAYEWLQTMYFPLWKPAFWKSTSSWDYPVASPSDQQEMQTVVFKGPKLFVAQVLHGWRCFTPSCYNAAQRLRCGEMSVVWELPRTIKMYKDFVEQCPCKCGPWRSQCSFWRLQRGLWGGLFCAGTIFWPEQSSRTLSGDPMANQ